MQYKVGDKVRVISNNVGAHDPDNTSNYVKKGKIITVSGVDSYGITYKLSDGNCNGLLLENIEPYDDSNSSDPTEVCKCDVWIRGCTCGVFKKEMEMKRTST